MTSEVGFSSTQIGSGREVSMQVNVEPFSDMMLAIRKELSDEAIIKAALPEGERLLNMAQAVSPFKTGALRGSARVEVYRGVQGLGLIIGFNIPYATLQDIGANVLPSKGFGSKKGPNQYFSEILQREAGNFYERVIRRLEKKIYRNPAVPRPRGKRRRQSFFGLRLPAPRGRVHFRGHTGSGASRVAGTQRGASSQYKSRVTSRAGTRTGGRR